MTTSVRLVVALLLLYIVPRVPGAHVVPVATVRATVLLPTDLGDLARDAGTIARGTVVAVESRWIEDQRTIDTLVTLQADNYLKGRLGPTLTFRVPGGRIGRLRSVTVGAPTFEAGQHVVVFLTTRGPEIPDLVGLSLGVFRVVGQSAMTVVPQPVGPSVRTAAVTRGDRGRRPMALAEFERRVRSLAGGGR
jgi:hypothetical protein